MKIWEKQENESNPAFEAFKIYLEMGAGRSYPKVTQKLSKSLTLIKRWAKVHDWEKRARAYDNSILEDFRADKKQRYEDFLKRQFEIDEYIQKAAAQALKEKDFKKASFKSINEMQTAAFARMNELAEKIGIDKVKDDKLIIEIVSVGSERNGNDKEIY